MNKLVTTGSKDPGPKRRRTKKSTQTSSYQDGDESASVSSSSIFVSFISSSAVKINTRANPK